MRSPFSRVWRWIVPLALPLTALAHASLDQSSPTDGSVVPTAPSRIVLRFSESAHLTAIGIQRQDGQDAGPIGPPPRTAGTQFVLPAPKLAAGIYTVRYRVLAVDDGHISAGKIIFTVGASAATHATAPGAAAGPAPQGSSAVGTVQQLDQSAGRVTIAHQAIAGLGWPAMTMTFAVKDTALYAKLSAGRHVQFTVAKQGSLYVVTQVH
jgi:Cu/Ag efflux protein CusF